MGYQRRSGVRLTQRVLPAMRERRWGRVIFLGTVGTEQPGQNNPDYYASKAALPVVVRSLAKELRGSGVTANLVSPGIIATAEVRSALEKRAGRHDIRGWDEVQRWALENSAPNLTGGIPDPEEMEDVAFIASEAAWHITGSDLKESMEEQWTLVVGIMLKLRFMVMSALGLVAFDIDGTLLRSDGSLSNRVRQALQEVKVEDALLFLQLAGPGCKLLRLPRNWLLITASVLTEQRCSNRWFAFAMSTIPEEFKLKGGDGAEHFQVLL